MLEIKALIRQSRLDAVLRALHERPDLPGVTVSNVTGFGRVVGRDDAAGPRFDSVPMCKLECLIPDEIAEGVVDLIREHAHTGRPGDGKIVLLPVKDIVRIRTGERGDEVL